MAMREPHVRDEVVFFDGALEWPAIVVRVVNWDESDEVGLCYFTDLGAVGWTNATQIDHDAQFTEIGQFKYDYLDDEEVSEASSD